MNSASIALFAITLIVVVPILAITIVWVVSLVTKDRTRLSASQQADETAQLQELHRNLEALTERIESLETLLLAEQRQDPAAKSEPSLQS